jgi:phosphoglycerate dehydrogenase-like enzyme
MSLSPEMRGLMCETRLRSSNQGAFLIDVARAEVFDEKALYKALTSQDLGGTALDVWYCYRTAPGSLASTNLPFGALENVIMAPHVSGWTEGMLKARANIVVKT